MAEADAADLKQGVSIAQNLVDSKSLMLWAPEFRHHDPGFLVVSGGMDGFKAW